MPARIGSTLLFTLLAAAGGIDATAQSICRPVLTVRSASLSPIYNGIRGWSATIDVDASPCSTSSGLFSIRLVRLSEEGPDFQFSEPLIWKREGIRVVLDFAGSESVLHYWIDDIATCPCRRG